MPGRKQRYSTSSSLKIVGDDVYHDDKLNARDRQMERGEKDNFRASRGGALMAPPKSTMEKTPPVSKRHLKTDSGRGMQPSGRNGQSGYNVQSTGRHPKNKPDPHARNPIREKDLLIEIDTDNPSSTDDDAEIMTTKLVGSPQGQPKQKQRKQQQPYGMYGLPQWSDEMTDGESLEWHSDESDDEEGKHGGGIFWCCFVNGCFCSVFQICLFVTVFLLLILIAMGFGVIAGMSWFSSTSASSSNALSTTPPTFPIQANSSPSPSPWTSSAFQPSSGVTMFPTEVSSSTPTGSPSLRIEPSSPPTSLSSGSPTESSQPSKGPTVAPSSSPSSKPTEFPTFQTIAQSDIMVGVYYYPWHADNFHNNGGYVRKVIGHTPLLGEYDDRSPEVIQQHLAWSRQANIRLWISSWWGPNRVEDTTLKDVILNHRDLGDHKVALLYESSGRIDIRREVTTRRVAGDIRYIADTYFDHPNYYRIDGRPVLFVYVTRVLEEIGVLTEILLQMRAVAGSLGHNVYIVGDHAFASAPEDNEWFPAFLYLDAVSNYDMYGAMGGQGGYAGNNGVAKYFRDQKEWRDQAHQNGCAFIPGISPGYNDRGVRMNADHKPLSRKLTANRDFGTLFRAVTKEARKIVDVSTSNLMIVNSFNEWHEDTQIEPAVGDTTNVPFDHTQGLHYEGYGTRYLDILREETE